MDFVTHTLVGTGAARLICRERNLLPQFSLAAMLASLLQDADPWLYLIDPSYYGKYHRVASHSALGLAGVALASAAIAWSANGVVAWRRFGWFVTENLGRELEPPRAAFERLLPACCAAAFLHWFYDAITGFGNMEPWWPWSARDYSLHAVTSFDAFIFGATLAWHVATRGLHGNRRRDVALTAAYLVAVGWYIAWRMHAGAPTVW